jgi:RNA polymerase primary sigma factor
VCSSDLIEQRRVQIFAAAKQLEPLLRAYDPLKDPGGKHGKLVADAIQELAGLLRLQPPRDTCLHILSEAAKRDRDDKNKQYRENLYKDPYAFMREHERAMLRAKELLRTHNMRLVLKVAHKRGGRGVDREVLLTEGAMGLVRAIESYDPSYGNTFATYAVHRVKQRINRCIDNEARLIRLPIHSVKLHRQLHILKAKFHQKHRRWPSDAELADMADTSTQTVKRLTDSSLNFPHSLSTPLSEGDDQSSTIGDMIPDANAENGVVEFTNRLQLRAKLTQAMMEVLTWKEERILRMRLGIALNDDLTLEEVSQKFDVTRERIRQIETKALRKLRGKKYIKEIGRAHV